MCCPAKGLSFLSTPSWSFTTLDIFPGVI
jgi:hypothetical protein